jgi:CHAT domain-containing protein/Flp pilus assembly protein TadD
MRVAMLKWIFLLGIFPFLTAAQINGTAQNETWEEISLKGIELKKAGDLDEALVWFEKARSKAEKQYGENHLNYASSLDNLAITYHDLNDFSKAESLYLKSSEIKLKLLGKNHPTYSTSLRLIAGLYNDAGDFVKAESFLLKALEVTEKENPKYTTTLNNLAFVYQVLGEYAKAESAYIEVLNEIARVVGRENELYCTTLNNLATLYQGWHDYAKAEPLLIEAKDLRARIVGKTHPDYATSLNNLAEFYRAMGNYTKAEPIHIEAKEIRAKALGRNHTDYVISVSNLGSLYMDMNECEKAEPLYLEAKNITENTLGRLHPSYSVGLENLGSLYLNCMDDLAKAESLFLEAAEITDRVYGKESLNYASSLNNLGSLYYMQENYQKAESSLLEVVNIKGKLLGKNNSDYATALDNLAVLLREMGKNEEAEHYYLECVAIRKQDIIRTFPSLSENEKKLYYDRNLNFEDFESFCLERFPYNPSIIDELYNLRLITKGILFNASDKMRQRILTSGDKELIKLYNKWQSKKDALIRVYQMGVDEKQKQLINDQILEDEINNIEKELSRKSELFSTINDRRVFTWKDVQRNLKPGEVAIEIVRTKRLSSFRDSTAYVALIVSVETKDHPDVIVLKNGGQFETKYINYYRNAIINTVSDNYSYDIFWRPISERTNGATKIYISTDGAYNQINLNTLLNTKSGQFLIDEVDIHKITSIKDLLVSNRITQVVKIKEAFLFGYPDYSNSKFNGTQIADLPATKKEIENISTLLRKKNILSNEYLYDKATESSIKNLNNPQLIHIASHGFFLPNTIDNESNKKGLLGIESKHANENQLLQSGLILTRTDNQKPSEASQTDDGILTAYEAMNLNLDKTDLVVLSACETGLGVNQNGEGVYGLQRSFQVAGAKAVLMSLWKVSDEVTMELMTLFYQNLLMRGSISESFKQAQVSLRVKYSEPYNWGAFVLVGSR